MEIRLKLLLNDDAVGDYEKVLYDIEQSLYEKWEFDIYDGDDEVYYVLREKKHAKEANTDQGLGSSLPA